MASVSVAIVRRKNHVYVRYVDFSERLELTDGTV
jgi:hypothetical protein